MAELEIMEVLKNFGFPVLVTLWFMFRTEKIISKNTEVIEQLSDTVKQLITENRKI